MTTLVSINSVAFSHVPGWYEVEAVIDYGFGPETCPYSLAPDDPHGLAPEIRAAVEQWIADGKPVAQAVPPPETPLPPLTARQLRLGLVKNGISLAAVESAIENIPDPVDRETAKIEWEYAATFLRDHPLISQIGAALSLTDDQIDSMWTAALAL